MVPATITGVSALPVRKHLSGSIRDAATTVALDAIAASGLERPEIDGLFVSPPGLSGPPGFMWSCSFAAHLGLTTRAQALVECGGMTAPLALRLAVATGRTGRLNGAAGVPH